MDRVHRQDFKEFIRISGMTPVRTRPYYPQSNGKNRTAGTNGSRESASGRDAAVAGDARVWWRAMSSITNVRLNQRGGISRRRTWLAGRQQEITREGRKLEAARKHAADYRQQVRDSFAGHCT